MLSAFLAGACLSDGWLMNWGCSYLWERAIACFTRATVLIGKVWFAPCTRDTEWLSLRSLQVSLISPLQHSSPQEIQQPTLEFLSEVERQEGLIRPFSLITFMIWNIKHKLVSQALWHWKSHALFHLKNNNLVRKYNTDLCSDAWRPCKFCPYMRCLPAYLLSLCLGGTRKSQ